MNPYRVLLETDMVDSAVRGEIVRSDEVSTSENYHAADRTRREISAALETGE
jgi:hypothetical protein